MPELPKCVSLTTHVLKSCDFRGGAAKVYFLYYTCTDKLRPSIRSCQSVSPWLRLSSQSCQGVFPLLHLYTHKLRPSSRSCQSFLVLKSCDFRAGAAKVYFLYCTCTEKLRLASRSCIAGFPHVNALEFGTWQSICMLANSCLSP